MTEIQEQKHRTADRAEFGKCLVEIMQSRNIFTATQLSQLMLKRSGKWTDRKIRHYWSGSVQKPAVDFMEDLRVVLDLSVNEMARLSTAIYFADVWREV